MGCKMPWWAGSETPPQDKDKIISDLRAEVASLKDENARLKAMPLASDPVRAAIYGEAIDRLNLQIAGNVSEIFDLTQQLAAANERIKELEEEVAEWSRNAWE